jgi:hypothetical protein
MKTVEARMAGPDRTTHKSANQADWKKMATYYNYDKKGHISRQCRALKKEKKDDDEEANHTTEHLKSNAKDLKKKTRKPLKA